MFIPPRVVKCIQGDKIGVLEKTVSESLPFFVYGSLRPDDVTHMPWKNEWLQGAPRLYKGQIHGNMFDDTYASVTLCSDGPTVKGFLVEFPATVYLDKLEAADDIEDHPDFYNRKKAVVTLENGRQVKAWVYTRAKCNKGKPVLSGDWVHYKTSRDPVLLDVKKFAESGFPIYQGQIMSNGKAAFENNISGMIDQMVKDAQMLDGQDIDRQVTTMNDIYYYI